METILICIQQAFIEQLAHIRIFCSIRTSFGSPQVSTQFVSTVHLTELCQQPVKPSCQPCHVLVGFSELRQSGKTYSGAQLNRVGRVFKCNTINANVFFCLVLLTRCLFFMSSFQDCKLCVLFAYSSIVIATAENVEGSERPDSCP